MTIVLNDGDVLDGLNDGERMAMFHKEEFDTLIKVKGDNVVIRNISVSHPKKDFHRVISVDGKNCLIEKCCFVEFDVNGAVIVLERKDRLDVPDNLIVKDCLFMNGRKTEINNGLEGIRLGWSGSSLTGKSNSIIYKNRFENWNREIEAISVKCNDNLLVNNEFIGCESTLTLRHGKNSVVAFNFFDGKNRDNSGGIRVVDTGHIIKGNYLTNIKGNGTLRCGVSLMCGVKDGELNRYGIINDCLIEFNVFVNCVDCMVLGVEKKEANVYPKHVIVKNNIYDRCKNIFTGKGKPFRDLGNIKGERLEYPNRPDDMDMNKYVDMRFYITSYEPEREEEEEEEEEEKIIEDNVKEFTNKILCKLYISEKLKIFDDIQNKMDSNIKEYRKLLNEMKKLME